jgi:hypothetical protein
MNVTEVLTQLVTLAKAHAWYPLCGAAVTLLVQLQKQPALRAYVWERLPAKARWVLPLALAGAAGFAKAYAEGSNAEGAVIEALSSVATSGVLAMGYDAALTNSPAPWGGGEHT